MPVLNDSQEASGEPPILSQQLIFPDDDVLLEEVTLAFEGCEQKPDMEHPALDSQAEVPNQVAHPELSCSQARAKDTGEDGNTVVPQSGEPVGQVEKDLGETREAPPTSAPPFNHGALDEPILDAKMLKQNTAISRGKAYEEHWH